MTRGADGAVQGFGVTKTTVTIGLPYSPGADAAAASLGASSVTSGDTKQVTEAVIADINAKGGILGRKLVAIYHEYDAASTQSVDQKYAEACADYMTDNQSFAVLDSGRPSLYDCVTKKGMIVSSDDYGYGTSDFTSRPYFVDTSTVTLERAMRGWIKTLSGQQYFSGWNTATAAPGSLAAKVGVLSVDYEPVKRAVEGVLLPGLKRIGHEVASENYVQIQNGNSTADAGRTVSEIQSAVLRFQSNGVTHVLIFDNAGGVTLFFAKGAENQSYYPRFGVTSQNAMQAWLQSGDVTKKQAAGAGGVGWAPNYDLSVDDTGLTSRWATPATKRCADILAKRGIRPISQNAQLIAYQFCDRLFFLEFVAKRMDPKQATREEFIRVVNGLGNDYVSPSLQKTFFGPGQHDGVVLGYDLRFNASCGCMGYTGGPFDLS